jgi:hypothetical protein
MPRLRYRRRHPPILLELHFAQVEKDVGHVRLADFGYITMPPNAGWKGHALWASDGNRTPLRRKTGDKTLPEISKYQIRPDSLGRQVTDPSGLRSARFRWPSISLRDALTSQ